MLDVSSEQNQDPLAELESTQAALRNNIEAGKELIARLRNS